MKYGDDLGNIAQIVSSDFFNEIITFTVNDEATIYEFPYSEFIGWFYRLPKEVKSDV